MLGIALMALLLLQGLIMCSADSAIIRINSFPKYESTKIRFLLWTRETHRNDFDYRVLKYKDLADIQESPFDGLKKTYVHFHGFTNEGTMKWILTSKTNILSVEDANILSVDYGTLVPAPEINYFKAVNTMYSVAEHVASYVDWLIQETELTTSQLHLIGHSLGAHAAGMTAKNIKSGIVERITGLDPAGPVFEYVISNLRLDKSQANFVDIIHTNACIVGARACRGIYKTIGHIDFYPNGGHTQPGCENMIGDIECSHQRVTDLWNESILPLQSKFTSWPCRNWFQFHFDFCTSCYLGCLNMGFYLSTSLQGTYYLLTNSTSPYAIGDQQFI